MNKEQQLLKLEQLTQEYLKICKTNALDTTPVTVDKLEQALEAIEEGYTAN